MLFESESKLQQKTIIRIGCISKIQFIAFAKTIISRTSVPNYNFTHLSWFLRSYAAKINRNPKPNSLSFFLSFFLPFSNRPNRVLKRLIFVFLPRVAAVHMGGKWMEGRGYKSQQLHDLYTALHRTLGTQRSRRPPYLPPWIQNRLPFDFCSCFERETNVWNREQSVCVLWISWTE